MLGIVLLAGLSAGCGCDGEPETTVLPISNNRHAALLSLYGRDGVPIDECERLCASRDGSPSPSLEACELTTIEFDQGAVACTPYPECSADGDGAP